MQNMWSAAYVLLLGDLLRIMKFEHFSIILAGHHKELSSLEDICICICLSVNTRVDVWTLPSVLFPCV